MVLLPCLQGTGASVSMRNDVHGVILLIQLAGLARQARLQNINIGRQIFFAIVLQCSSAKQDTDQGGITIKWHSTSLLTLLLWSGVQLIAITCPTCIKVPTSIH